MEVAKQHTVNSCILKTSHKSGLMYSELAWRILEWPWKHSILVSLSRAKGFADGHLATSEVLRASFLWSAIRNSNCTNFLSRQLQMVMEALSCHSP